MKTINTLKKVSLATFLTFILSFSSVFAQNDTMYIMKSGAIVGQYNVNTEVDSVIFYKPTVAQNDTGGGYAIGDTGPSGVGIVFYVTDGGLHGLEVAPVDQSTSQVWIEGGSTQTTKNGNTSTAIGTGLANSNAIIDQTGHTGSAAQVCRSYNGGGLTDWYLPSKDELAAIWANLVNDGTGVNSGVGGFASASYWSSTENDNDYAWLQLFDDGSQGYTNKGSTDRVRAVRAF